MIKLLTTPWMTSLVSVLIYLGAMVMFWKTPPPPKPAPEVVSTGKRLGPSWDFINPEADQLMAELKTEKAALSKKEQDLSDLAVRLQAEQAEMNLVTQSVRQLQVDFDQNVLRIGVEETANLKKLAKVYANMDPASAAKIIQEMDDVGIIKIMVFMKDTETAVVLEAMAKMGQTQAKRAAALSDRLRLASFRTSTPPPK
jgi:flagellar motility protein MotE (MotC chaperone)